MSQTLLFASATAMYCPKCWGINNTFIKQSVSSCTDFLSRYLKLIVFASPFGIRKNFRISGSGWSGKREKPDFSLLACSISNWRSWQARSESARISGFLDPVDPENVKNRISPFWQVEVSQIKRSVWNLQNIWKWFPIRAYFALACFLPKLWPI